MLTEKRRDGTQKILNRVVVEIIRRTVDRRRFSSTDCLQGSRLLLAARDSMRTDTYLIRFLYHIAIHKIDFSHKTRLGTIVSIIN